MSGPPEKPNDAVADIDAYQRAVTAASFFAVHLADYDIPLYIAAIDLAFGMPSPELTQIEKFRGELAAVDRRVLVAALELHKIGNEIKTRHAALFADESTTKEGGE